MTKIQTKKNFVLGPTKYRMDFICKLYKNKNKL